MSPEYDKAEFERACRENQAAVFVHKKALDGASEDFGLRSKKELLIFIGDGGTAKCALDNVRPYEHWQGPPPAPIVDSYTFEAGYRRGYIAYYKPPTGIWNLKSFKRDAATSDLSSPFKDLEKLLRKKLLE